MVAFSPCDGDLAAAEFLILVDGEDGIAFADGDARDHVDIGEGFAGDFGTDPCTDLEGRDAAAAASVWVVDLSGDVELTAAGVDAAGCADDAAFPFARTSTEVRAERDGWAFVIERDFFAAVAFREVDEGELFAAEGEVDFCAVDGVDAGDFASGADVLADVGGFLEDASGVGGAERAAFEVAEGALFGGLGGFEAGEGFGELGLAGDERAWFAGSAEGFPVVEGLGGAGLFFGDGGLGLGDGASGDGDGGLVVAVVELDEEVALFEEAAFAEGWGDVVDDAADFGGEGAFGAGADFASGGEDDGIVLRLDSGGGDWGGRGGAAAFFRWGRLVCEVPAGGCERAEDGEGDDEFGGRRHGWCGSGIFRGWGKGKGLPGQERP